MNARAAAVVVAMGLVLGALAGCEKAQTLDPSASKPDAPAWAESPAAHPAYMAPGWKAGDRTAWEEQIRKRNQAQNDYLR